MKKIFAIIVATLIVPSFHSYAWVGGPFSNNNYTPEGDDGIYEAIALPTAGSGVGLYRWGVFNNNPAAAGIGESNVQFGGFITTQNQHVFYFGGISYYGTCFGTVNASLGGVVSCVGHANTLDEGGTAALNATGVYLPTTASNITASTANSFFIGNFRRGNVLHTDASRNFTATGELSIDGAAASPLIVFGSRVSLLVTG